ncbi:MOXD1 homolog 2-like [Anastrepha ludens]|uniref:MOXD1 homolog 2-like n=1 Tax=Anastrepha ludens TaxID=28586 RepID=UPI0023AF5D81|nr:MOXD1 homolog 2-like [Anastrepha ludens]XP_053955144.1 MOXD1 homolog 2-like [Anastrepha ludens]
MLQSWIFLSCSFSLLTAVESMIGRKSLPLDVEKTNPMAWDHTLDLNDDFRLLWTIINDDAVFEIQVKTRGFVGVGFSKTGSQEGTDIAIGWVDKGQTFFQDRHVPTNKNSTELLVDPSQDYILLIGYENATHTIVRFRRKLDTCDSMYDIPITNNTMRVMFLYDDNDPPNGSVSPGSLPNLKNAWRQPRSVVLIERFLPTQTSNSEKTHKLEFRNSGVELPFDDDTLIWCTFFKLDKLEVKNHIVKYEPIFDSSWSLHYLQYMTLYECTGSGPELEALAHEPGHQCHNTRNTQISCHSYMASWSRGSSAFIYPPEVGYPLDTNSIRFVMMETHYNNLEIVFENFKINHMFDSSGLRLYITQSLRANDAGLMSLGIEPNWHHIIPPGQKRVVSQGHCVEQCTHFNFPSEGINIFATMMRTHQIGAEVKLRQIRNMRELAPIVSDGNIDQNYQTFRRLPQVTRSLPGDRLIAECVYDSSSRRAITLGGSSMKEESCMIFALYYPKQDTLTSCHSSPSLATVLHSLGIEYLNANSDPVVISLPTELKGMTLETRLLTYDWDNQFKAFQDITLNGAFKVLCQSGKSTAPTSPNSLTGWPVNITQTFIQPNRCNTKRPSRSKFQQQIQQHNVIVMNDIPSNDIVELSVRNSRSSFSETLALSGIKPSSASHGRELLPTCFMFMLIAYAMGLS